jgi:hypothetical protein
VGFSTATLDFTHRPLDRLLRDCAKSKSSPRISTSPTRRAAVTVTRGGPRRKHLPDDSRSQGTTPRITWSRGTMRSTTVCVSLRAGRRRVRV